MDNLLKFHLRRTKRHEVYMAEDLEMMESNPCADSTSELWEMLCLLGYNIGGSGRIWSLPSSDDWWENVARPGWREKDWTDHLRVSRHLFLFLVDKLEQFIKTEDTVLSKAIPTERKVAITLWWLATGEDYRSLGQRFGVCKSTACNIFNLTFKALYQMLFKKYVRWLTPIEVAQSVQTFNGKFGYPQCAGAINGTHNPIIAPAEHAGDYFNRKGTYSINVQAVVDAFYRFVDVVKGWPGSVHDARILGNSSICQRAEDGTLFPENRRIIPGVSVPIHLVGDGAYFHRTWLQKPYPDTGLSEDQILYNQQFSRARVVVEHSFGQLKGRWRCLLKRNDAKTDKLNIIKACMLLHNLCIECKVSFQDRWYIADNNDVVPEEEGPPSNGDRKAAEFQRQALVRFFKS